MDASYIAGFFDGEGSAMVLTIKRTMGPGTIYRLRPVIRIAQKASPILVAIRDWLGYGTVVGHKAKVHALQINGNKNVVRFVEAIAPFCHIKRFQLERLKELALFQTEHSRNAPYSRADIEKMLEMRDAVFNANTWTRSRIAQKYTKESVLAHHTFVDYDEWQYQRLRGTRAIREQKAKERQERAQDLIPCACGCGQMISRWAKGRPTRERRFEWRHNLRVHHSTVGRPRKGEL